MIVSYGSVIGMMPVFLITAYIPLKTGTIATRQVRWIFGKCSAQMIVVIIVSRPMGTRDYRFPWHTALAPCARSLPVDPGPEFIIIRSLSVVRYAT